jgi:hypothetical protein
VMGCRIAAVGTLAALGHIQQSASQGI